MAAIKADPGIGREAAPVGSRAWAERIRLTMQGLVASVQRDPETIKWYVDLINKHQAWTLMNRDDGSFFVTFEEFCEYRQPWGLGRPWAKLKPFIVAACDGNEAQVEALGTTPEAAPSHASVIALQPRDASSGRLRTKPVRNDSNERSRGNKTEYLAARIARDAPDVAEKMKAGEYPSVRAAARAAGLVKDPDPVKVAARALKKVPAERMGEVLISDVKGVQQAIRRLTREEQVQVYEWLSKTLEQERA
jgi:hypothetical protein